MFLFFYLRSGTFLKLSRNLFVKQSCSAKHIKGLKGCVKELTREKHVKIDGTFREVKWTERSSNILVSLFIWQQNLIFFIPNLKHSLQMKASLTLSWTGVHPVPPPPPEKKNGSTIRFVTFWAFWDTLIFHPFFAHPE